MQPTFAHLVTPGNATPTSRTSMLSSPGPTTPAGGYTRKTAIDVAEEKGDLLAFARPYIANPDLPYRLIALAVGDRAMYYVPGSVDPNGFTDYPFAVTA
ncbi:hypothetical protein C8R47DRAFT_1214411 [Mycena vitilis]|nr:hypothetical protein C8R47DRAFT_1214411 [Mycena vitilis]